MNRDAFDAWSKDPTTEWLFSLLRKAAEREKAEWVRQSWEGGEVTPEVLLELRTRANALTELCDNEFEDWKEWDSADD